MSEFELDVDERNEYGQWRRWTILHKQWHALTGRETTLNQLHWRPPHYTGLSNQQLRRLMNISDIAPYLT